MKIEAEDVRHVARLAEVAIEEAAIDRLATELQAIVTFVERLGALEGGVDSEPLTVGPERVTLRDDVVSPIPMVRGPADLAPAFADGFFVVPKLGGLAGE
jgi:aspartyl-tRNA(Asn)/glutamyl-tRNA(Gln) amidotransferase subunit C